MSAMILFGEAHLRRILEKYVAYYNGSRVHRSLNKDAPFPASTKDAPFPARLSTSASSHHDLYLTLRRFSGAASPHAHSGRRHRARPGLLPRFPIQRARRAAQPEPQKPAQELA